MSTKYRYSFCGVLTVMDVVSFVLFMFVHVMLSNGLTGENICMYNENNR